MPNPEYAPDNAQTESQRRTALRNAWQNLWADTEVFRFESYERIETGERWGWLAYYDIDAPAMATFAPVANNASSKASKKKASKKRKPD